MVNTLTASGACVLKAGANVSSEFTGTSAETNWNILIPQIEAVINSRSRYNWVDNYATLNTDVKYLLEEIASNLAAIYAIQYDLTSFASLSRAQTKMDVLHDGANRGLKLLDDEKNRRFIQTA